MRQEKADDEMTAVRDKNGLSAKCLGRGRAILVVFQSLAKTG